jgi:hypothetical protein
MGPDGPAGPKGDPGTLAFAISTPLSEFRVTTVYAVNQWVSLPGRVVSLVKVSDTSRLRITYQDTLGAKAVMFNACQWRIVVDGTTWATFSDGDLDNPNLGYRMHNGSHIAWVFNIPAGTHDIHVDSMRTINGQECLSGWNTTGNFLSVEEIP